MFDLNTQSIYFHIQGPAKGISELPLHVPLRGCGWEQSKKPALRSVPKARPGLPCHSLQGPGGSNCPFLASPGPQLPGCWKMWGRVGIGPRSEQPQNTGHGGRKVVVLVRNEMGVGW